MIYYLKNRLKVERSAPNFSAIFLLDILSVSIILICSSLPVNFISLDFSPKIAYIISNDRGGFLRFGRVAGENIGLRAIIGLYPSPVIVYFLSIRKLRISKLPFAGTALIRTAMPSEYRLRIRTPSPSEFPQMDADVFCLF